MNKNVKYGLILIALGSFIMGFAQGMIARRNKLATT